MRREDRAEVEPGQTPHNHVTGTERRHVGLCIVCGCRRGHLQQCSAGEQEGVAMATGPHVDGGSQGNSPQGRGQQLLLQGPGGGL